MASVRNLKKDIDFIVSEVISDAQLCLYLNPKSNAPELTQIIEDAVELWNELYARTNHPDGKHDPKLVKKHYQSIRKDLFESSHKLFERLSNLTK